MEYLIISPFIGNELCVSIDKTAFDKYREAAKNFLQIKLIEEKFDLILQNFQEFQSELISQAINYGFDLFSYQTRIINNRLTINRRIANFLMSVRLYLDQYLKHIEKIYGEKSEVSCSLTCYQQSVYDQDLFFQVLYELRNYVQHTDLPVHLYTLPSSWTNLGEEGKLCFKTIPYINVLSLKDVRFKKETVEKLQKMFDKDYLDLRFLLGKGLASLVNIHMKYKELVAEDLKKWTAELNELLSVIQPENRDHQISIACLLRKEDGKILEKINVAKAFLDDYEFLNKRHTVLNKIDYWIFTNEINEKEININR